MQLTGEVAVVTGGGSGFGAALCRGLAAEGAHVVAVDLHGDRAREVAAEVGGLAVEADVSVEEEVQRAVDEAGRWRGPVEVMISNAGVVGPSDVFTGDDCWDREWRVHVMSNLYAARAVLPSMLERGCGWLVSTASAVGLTNQPGTAAYVVTKHAQVALAEHLALTYADRGIQVSCICPLGMRTGMTASAAAGADPADRFGATTLIDADEAAARALAQLHEGRFLVLTHPEVATYAARRGADHDRWLAGLRRMYTRLRVREPAAG
ncbi:SDR family oxidoreductase [Pseudofrankia sp. BMG5.37]|uniref:SDR family NAD(P)-dependent oxidoreductase n=1 Tax=Pseudofrankia sp. BMG5.37 TaxID=3050035 RepID=UPI002893EDA0|nr:SDR family oxidoreductase [Pseudofrankia sp. BMG5.37]MDT3441899.1 SDR family oxidoreductase [Pseudofrankia sp. BMG5.37]